MNSVDTARRQAARVGLITLPIGFALLAAPARVGRLLSTGDHAASWRAIGLLDLALVPGLLAGRRPSRWMTARAGLNLGIAGFCWHLMRRETGVTGAAVGAAAMVLATVADGRTIAALRRAGTAAEDLGGSRV